MYLGVVKEAVKLVNLPNLSLDVLRLQDFPLEQKVFSFSIPRERWTKELFKLQGG